MKKLVCMLLIFGLCGIGTGMQYQGNLRLCVWNYTGGKTCLSSGDTYDLSDAQEYYFVLQAPEKEKNLAGFVGYFQTLVIGGGMGILLIFLTLYFIRKFI